MNVTFEQLPALVAELVLKVETLTQAVNEQKTAKEEDVLMNVKDVAAFLGCSMSTIYHSKDIPSTQRLGKKYFSKAEVMAWVKDGKPKAVVSAPAYSVVKKGRTGKY